jgi:hypothetical protein
LELHNLTPSGIFHIAAFVTLCEAFMGIDPHFDLWHHFFRIRLPQGMNVEVAVLGGVGIQVKSGHGVDPYFNLPMVESVHGWRKM